MKILLLIGTKNREAYIMSYDYDNVDNFLAKIPFKTLNEIEAENPTGNSQASLFGNNL